MELIKDKLLENRPTLSEGTIKTYVSCLKSLHKKLWNEEPVTLANFFNMEVIMAHMQPIEYNKRKTCLAGLVVLTGEECYRGLMMQDIKQHETKMQSQDKDGVFADNLITPDEVLLITIKAKKLASFLYNKGNPSMKEICDIQNYVLLCLTTGIYIAPRRSADWNIKWRNYNVDEENYLDLKAKKFVFNNYKTVKTYGACFIDIPKELLTIIKKYLKIIPEGQDNLLFNRNGHAINESDMRRRLNGIFEKNISTSMLRHIYLTGKYSFVNLKEMTEDAVAMGTSVGQLMQYVKIPAPLADNLVAVDVAVTA
jgi:hypothetical protein